MDNIENHIHCYCRSDLMGSGHLVLRCCFGRCEDFRPVVAAAKEDVITADEETLPENDKNRRQTPGIAMRIFAALVVALMVWILAVTITNHAHLGDPDVYHVGTTSYDLCAKWALHPSLYPQAHVVLNLSEQTCTVY